jgi:hypothetical protein
MLFRNCFPLSAAASCLDLNIETRRLFIGQENGTISVSCANLMSQPMQAFFFFIFFLQEFQLSEDYNSMPHSRNYIGI